jgi:phthiocerol/phenolphthiocerol synthesis type-I polyketide synthase E
MPHSYESEGFEVAIIGMAGRFPGARSLEEYWNNIRNGVESIRILNAGELAARGVTPERSSAPNFVPAAAQAPDTDLFAASFFGYSPREAELMDPQHRVFLECAWEAVENAGYAPRSLEGLTGVFAGASLSAYMLFNLLASGGSGRDDEFQAMIGSDKDFLSTRLAYKLNLHGPSFTVQSGCSTSLVAIHLAVQNLLTYQCDMAIAGGASIGVPQRVGYEYEPNGILSPDGRNRAFDAQAAGTVFGEGVGTIVLKRLEDALRDRDSIHALILGTAINNDGSAKIGFTAPSVEGQASVISKSLAVAGVSADTVSYVEAHGTATALGDPVEMAALTKAFRQTTDRRNFCGVGSVKSNIGHLDAAAGVAGLIKTVLMLKHRYLAPSLHFCSPNPKIDFNDSPFYVVSKLHEWKSENVRRAGVSSFGIGGTNAHAVLQEAPLVVTDGKRKRFQVLCLSAQTDVALDRISAGLESFLEGCSDEAIADVAYTLHVGREHFSRRRSWICQDRREALEQLKSQDSERIFTSSVYPNAKVGFMFPGGGVQYPGMGADLYEAEPEFKKHVDRCLDILSKEIGQEMRPYLYPTTDDLEWAATELKRPSLGLPATFLTEYALAQLLISWGVRPQCMIGHSLGEYVIGCLAEVFSLKDALSLVVYRGKLFERLSSGAMLSVYLGEAEAQSLIGKRVEIAAVNSPDQCVLSGPSDAIAEISELLSSRDIEFHRLHIDTAAHCSLLEPAMEDFRTFLSSMNLGSPSIPFISNLTGTWITVEQASSADYWVDHLRRTVRFSDGIAEMFRQENLIVLEVGPSRNLSTLAKGRYRGRSAFIHACMRHPQDPISEQACLFRTLAQIWNMGVTVDWRAFYGEERRRRIPLPTYPFERERFWVAPKSGEAFRAAAPAHPVYTQCSKLAPLPAGDAKRDVLQHVWVLFMDDFGIGEAMRKALLEQGARVVAITAGERLGRDAEDGHEVHPASEADMYSVLQSLDLSGKEPLSVVHLWSLTQQAPVNGLERGNRFQASQERSAFSLLALLRALGKLSKTPAVHLTVATTGTVQVSGADACCPENSAFASAFRVIPQEFENHSGRIVDVVLDRPGASVVRRIALQILSEIQTGAAESVVAYRGHRRYALEYRSTTPLHASDRPVARRHNGVYLVVGGLGNLGPVLAESFARRGACKIILAGRSNFPEKSQWEQWLRSRPAEDRTSRVIQQLQAVEAKGAEIFLLGMDVEKSAQVRSSIDEIERRFGQLHGVVHLAGAAGSKILRLMSDLDPAEFWRQTSAKVEGSYALASALEGRELDFCVLFSSTASVLGGAGLSGYAAANGFLDSFAMERSLTSGQRWIGIGWDAWMTGENLGYVESGRTGLDKFAIGAEKAADIFHTILESATGGHYVVSTGDLQSRFLEITALRAPGKSHNETNEVNLPEVHARPMLASEYVPPVTDLQREIAAVWGEVLGLDKVGLNDNLFDLGGNSLIGLRIVSRLKRKLGVEVPVVSLFEGPTVFGLSQLLGSENSTSDYLSSRSRGELRRKRRAARAE